MKLNTVFLQKCKPRVSHIDGSQTPVSAKWMYELNALEAKSLFQKGKKMTEMLIDKIEPVTTAGLQQTPGIETYVPAGGQPVLHCENIEKVYGSRGNITRALDGISFNVNKGEYVAIMGASGSGKTTLLNCISSIDRVTSGHIYVAGRDITNLRSKQLSQFRRDDLGFIFQDSNILDTLTAYENIALALTIKKVPHREIEMRVAAVAEHLSITDTLKKFPYQLSGGQKQRVAAARAIITNPSLVLADEPTGALDSKSAKMLLESFDMLNKNLLATILMVTHDSFAASYTKRVIFIQDGKIFTELVRGDQSRKEFFNRIIEVVSFLGGENNDVL